MERAPLMIPRTWSPTFGGVVVVGQGNWRLRLEMQTEPNFNGGSWLRFIGPPPLRNLVLECQVNTTTGMFPVFAQLGLDIPSRSALESVAIAELQTTSTITGVHVVQIFRPGTPGLLIAVDATAICVCGRRRVSVLEFIQRLHEATPLQGLNGQHHCRQVG